MNGLNVNVSADSPGERVVLGLLLLNVLLNIADVDWLKPDRAPVMTHERAVMVCGGDGQVKRLAAYEVECFDPLPEAP